MSRSPKVAQYLESTLYFVSNTGSQEYRVSTVFKWGYSWEYSALTPVLLFPF